DLILFHSLCPETLTASSDIPVAHVVNKFLKRTGSFRDPVVSEMIVHVFYHSIHLGQEPLIHNGKLVILQFIFCGVKFIYIRIANEECVGIPQCSHELSLSFGHCFAVETVRQPRSAVDIEVPADRICAVCLKSLERIDCISLGLAHLLSVLILHMSEDDDVL